jgi:DNA-binding NarL/FixJ family response regulator
MTDALRVVVVEDHPIFRETLSRALDDAPGVVLAEAFRTVEELERSPVRPDVVILDLHLPGASGPEAVERVSRRAPALVVSASGNKAEVVDAVGAGARGYLTKDADVADILLALEHVAGGGTYVSPTLASYLLTASEEHDKDELALSPREREILAMVAAGERDQDIADLLAISVRTVRSHLDRIRDKTGQRRRPDLTRFAIEHGIDTDDGRDP